MKDKKNIVILGASGHGKVVADIVIKSGDNLLGFLDDNTNLGKKIMGFPVLGTLADINKYSRSAEFIFGIGNNYIRKQIAENHNINWYIAVHPSSVIATDVKIGAGTVVMANASINPATNIGKHCIINTGAVVEHDNNIADYVHISPNASIGGTVSVGELTHIGIGAAVKNNVNITDECVIGAGAVVVKDITEKGTYIGVPARRRK